MPENRAPSSAPRHRAAFALLAAPGLIVLAGLAAVALLALTGAALFCYRRKIG